MWWYYEKRFENDEYIDYAYSRESRDLDGLIRLDKKAKVSYVVTPCGKDKDHESYADASLEFVYILVEEGFPKTRFVATG